MIPYNTVQEASSTDGLAMLSEESPREAEVEIENLPSDSRPADNISTEVREVSDEEFGHNTNPVGSRPSTKSPSVASEGAYTESSTESSTKENEGKEGKYDKERKLEKRAQKSEETDDEDPDWETFPGSEADDREIGRGRQQMLRSSRLSNLGFHDRLAAVSIRHLYGKGTGSRTQNSETYNIALSTLQRMVIHDLQRKLILLVKRIIRRQEVSDAALKRARALMAQYTIAIRDYDYMTEKLSQATETEEHDPFMITTNNALSLYLMKESLLVPSEQNVQARDRVDYIKRINILPGTSRTKHNDSASLAQLWQRIWMGVCGGLALMGPMLLMVLHKDEATTLSTASVATMLFALGLAFLGKGLKDQEVLASVAAYAAVLVVFVGASS